MQNSVYSSIKVFISYSHKDTEFKDKLIVHMSTLRRNRIITSWTDNCINPGDDFEKEIDVHLNDSNIILLLISPDFIASDFCYDKEMNKALERHRNREAVVIPIIVRPTDLSDTPFMKIQSLPTALKPVSTWDNEDLAFQDIVTGIKKAIKRLVEGYQNSDKKKPD